MIKQQSISMNFFKLWKIRWFQKCFFKIYVFLKMSKDSSEEIEEAFNAFDIEGTGLMTLDNLKQISH